MSPSQTQDVLSEDIAVAGDNDGTRLVRHKDGGLVPVAESIRYRKRAQNAEKKAEVLAEQLVQAQAQTAELSEQLSTAQAEQKLVRQLAAAGAGDLETAVLLVKERMAKAKTEGQGQADTAGIIEQLKKEKQYLFGGAGTGPRPAKTAGARDRLTSNETILERAAKKAATSGSRADLHEYLRLRRNFL